MTSLFSFNFPMFSYIYGFWDLCLIPGEAAAILLKAEHWLGQEISHKEIDEGHLASLLIPDDYLDPFEVSALHIHFNTQLLTSKFCKWLYAILLLMQ